MRQQLFWAVLVLLGTTDYTFAAFSFSGSGVGTGALPISASAEFDFVTHDFGSGAINAVEITLTNTAASTTVRGNLITGLFFSLSGSVGNLPTTTAGFDGVAAIVRLSNATNASNVDIAPAVNGGPTDGTYQLSNGPFGIANSGGDYSSFEYAIATVGMGLTGLNGAALNGDDFGIFAAGSGVDLGGLGAARPIINSTATFWIARPAEWTNLSQIGSDVRITYGSLPDNFITATTAVPEARSLLIWGFVIAAAAVMKGASCLKQLSSYRHAS